MWSMSICYIDSMAKSCIASKVNTSHAFCFRKNIESHHKFGGIITKAYVVTLNIC